MTTRPPRLADWPERHARWPQRAPSRSSGRRSRGPAARLHEAACVSAALGASPRRPTHPASCWHSSRGGDAAAAALCPGRRRAVPHACRLLCLELIVLIRSARDGHRCADSGRRTVAVGCRVSGPVPRTCGCI